MKIYSQFSELSDLTTPIFLAIGVFDGVHLGHQSVIGSAVNTAKITGGLSGVLTFDPHPSRTIKPDQPSLLMMPLSQKLEVFSALGLDFTIVKHFDAAFASLSAEMFLQELKTRIPMLEGVFIGENFRFGKGRSGGLQTLLDARSSYGFHVTAVPRLSWDGEAVSSTRLRQELKRGNMEAVASMFGRAYTVRGQIVSGRQLGRTIGFPTVNVPWSPELTPPFGVYAVEIVSEKRKPMKGVANYGVRPTVESFGEPLFEVHTFDPSEWKPGEDVTIAVHHFIRPEKKFDSLDALREQIAIDKAVAMARK